jgi:flagellar hook-length control protein FliK
MGLAGSAIGMIQKAFTHTRVKADFDEHLNTAIARGDKPDKALSDDEEVKKLLESPQAGQLFQYMSALKSLGVNSQDAQALFLGNASNVSDDGLKAILASCGVQDSEISRIMADPKLLSDMKAALAESVSSDISKLFAGSMQDMNLLIMQATADQTTYDTVVAAVATGMSAETPEGAQSTGTITTAAETSAFDVQAKIQARTLEIKNSIAALLKSLDGTTGKTTQDASAAQAVAETRSDITQAVRTLEQTFGISRKSLKDIFLAKNSLVRQTAVNEATSKITSYLNTNADKTLTKQATDALALLKGSLSKEEFAPIENAVSLFSPDTMIAGSAVSFNKQGFEALSNIFQEKSDASFSQLTQQVIDQIKQAVPQQVKSSEGSISLKLNPPMLGKVDVDIHVENGLVQASFKADQPITRDILQQNMHILKDALAEQGVKVAQVSVSADVNARTSQQNAFAWTGSQNGNNGSFQQGRGQDTGTPKGREGYVRVPGLVNGYSESGGLDIFA